jgi:hypothetical protein
MRYIHVKTFECKIAVPVTYVAALGRWFAMFDFDGMYYASYSDDDTNLLLRLPGTFIVKGGR